MTMRASGPDQPDSNSGCHQYKSTGNQRFSGCIVCPVHAEGCPKKKGQCQIKQKSAQKFNRAEFHAQKSIMTLTTGSGRLSAISMASLNCSIG